ncbi:MAG: recombination mediator RecR [bacterium]
MNYAQPLQKLIDALELLPGIGNKSAQRIALYLLRTQEDRATTIANAILDLRVKVKQCTNCFNFSENSTCPVCQDSTRDRTIITVIGDVRDLMALENSGTYHGMYHVLGGLLNPMEGIKPEHLHVRELISRLSDGEVKEIILALNPTPEGDVTSLYLSRLIKPLGVTVSRIAMGLPVGGELDYADSMTIIRAMEGRTSA